MPIVTIKPPKASLIANPFIYPKAIISNTKTLLAGDLVTINDEVGNPIGMGIFNPNSFYRIRLLWSAYERYRYADLPQLLHYRFTQAIALRQQLNLPNEQTNVYRLFNSEADGLSGLTIDIYDHSAVVLSTAYWVELHQAAIKSVLHELLPKHTIYWRAQQKYLQQEGWGDVKNDTDKAPQLIVKENDIAFHVDLTQGQKSGFFVDQRDNRLLIRQLAKDKKVLDVCCYSGGFALNAAKGGASFVRALDSSAPAITWAKKNAAENKLNVEFLNEDAKEFLAKHTDNYDLIILDPPKLAPSKEDLAAASRLYFKFNELALQRVNPGGLLLTCSCSSAMTNEYLLEIVMRAALKHKRRIVLLGEQHAAPDHPRLPHFAEGDYLSVLLLRVE